MKQPKNPFATLTSSEPGKELQLYREAGRIRFAYVDKGKATGIIPRAWPLITASELRDNESLRADAPRILAFYLLAIVDLDTGKVYGGVDPA